MVAAARIRQALLLHEDLHKVNVELKHVAEHLLVEGEVKLEQLLQVLDDAAGMGLQEGVVVVELLVTGGFVINVRKAMDDAHVAVD